MVEKNDFLDVLGPAENSSLLGKFEYFGNLSEKFRFNSIFGLIFVVNKKERKEKKIVFSLPILDQIVAKFGISEIRGRFLNGFLDGIGWIRFGDDSILKVRKNKNNTFCIDIIGFTEQQK